MQDDVKNKYKGKLNCIFKNKNMNEKLVFHQSLGTAKNGMF